MESRDREWGRGERAKEREKLNKLKGVMTCNKINF